MTEHLTGVKLAQTGDILNRITMVYQAKVVGQENLRTVLTACLLADGHVLIESVPGLAKTTAAQTLASAVSGTFHWIQCTPDLMSNDIVGSQIWNQTSGKMAIQLGPVHTNLALMDEINRSSAKTQSTMLETMQEGQTMIGGANHRLSRPFMAMVTRNPIEGEGTYVLPEAQMDRFLLEEIITYPAPVEELEALEHVDSGMMSLPTSSEPVSVTDVLLLQDLTRRIYMHDTLKAYIADIVNAARDTGPNPLPGWTKRVRVGASPRGAIALMQISRALALMDGRNYVVPDDVRKLRYSILRYRIIRTSDALADSMSVEGLIDAVFNAVPVPWRGCSWAGDHQENQRASEVT